MQARENSGRCTLWSEGTSAFKSYTRKKTKYLEGQRNWKRCRRFDRMPHERNYEHSTQREQTQ